MASTRFVDRGFWKCRELNGLNARTRLLAIYLFSDEADDYGRLKDDVYRFRLGCFPDSDVTDEDVAKMINDLEEIGFLAPYESQDGRPLLWIRNFITYQPMGYRAKPRLERHPDDPHPVYAKHDKPTDKHPTCGNLRARSAKVRKVPGNSGKFSEIPSPTPIPIPIPMPARAGAPEGQRAEPDAANDVEAFAAELEPGDAEAAPRKGRGTDAPTANDHDAFDGADDSQAASKAWTEFDRLTNSLNGKGERREKERLRTRALVRGLVQRDHDGRVRAIALAIQATGPPVVSEPWDWLLTRLQSGKGSDGDAKARREAKRLLEGAG
jgi:hypothetical protein